MLNVVIMEERGIKGELKKQTAAPHLRGRTQVFIFLMQMGTNYTNNPATRDWVLRAECGYRDRRFGIIINHNKSVCAHNKTMFAGVQFRLERGFIMIVMICYDI